MDAVIVTGLVVLMMFGQIWVVYYLRNKENTSDPYEEDEPPLGT